MCKLRHVKSGVEIATYRPVHSLLDAMHDRPEFERLAERRRISYRQARPTVPNPGSLVPHAFQSYESLKLKVPWMKTSSSTAEAL